MSLNFLSFNEEKTVVILFGPSRTSDLSLFYLGYLEQYLNSTVTNCGLCIIE